MYNDEATTTPGEELHTHAHTFMEFYTLHDKYPKQISCDAVAKKTRAQRKMVFPLSHSLFLAPTEVGRPAKTQLEDTFHLSMVEKRRM